MSPQHDDIFKPKRSRQPLVTYGLISICVSIGATTLIGLFVGAAFMGRENQFLAIVSFALAGLLVIGLSGCALTLGALAMIRRLTILQRNMAAIDQRTTVIAEQAVNNHHDPSTETISLVDPTESVKLLEEIREILLLPEQARSRRFKSLVKKEFKRHLDAAERLIAAREFHQAREQLKTLTDRFGTNDQVKEMEDKLEKTVQIAQQSDVQRGSEEIEDLLGLAQFDDAEQLARELIEKYPSAEEPRQWLEHIQEQRQQFETEHRQQMHDQIQQYVNDRQWIKALESARQFVETFPKGQDADALREQMETLEANADIQSRQEVEKQYKDYLSEKKYWEALSLARHIINEYPLSPQADALRGQIARVEELARQQRAS